jgi:hypothetical protein
MKWMLVGFWAIWVTTLCVSRIFIFHEAYSTHVAKVKDEQWLAEQCSKPEFYSNIRQHTDLCEVISPLTSPCLFVCIVHLASAHQFLLRHRMALCPARCKIVSRVFASSQAPRMPQSLGLTAVECMV